MMIGEQNVRKECMMPKGECSMFIQRLFASIRLWFSLMRVSYQTAYGYYHLLRLPKPMVTIFGASRASQQDGYATWAHQLSQMLSEVGISVVTGGGPGIMEAASCGVKQNATSSVGIGVKNLGEGRNPCVSKYIELDYFYARKWLLTRYSSGFIVFPGGFGTLDEMAEVITLVQTQKLPAVPIVLIGIEYWETFMDWLKREPLGHNYIEEEHLELFVLTDDVQEAFAIVRNACQMNEKECNQKENG